MPAATESTTAPVEPEAPDELQLLCIACHGEVGRQEKVIYWPPTKKRPGVIAHYRCIGEESSS